MKIEGTQTEQDFKPVQVTFTFETQKELDVIGSLFASANITNRVRELLDSEMCFSNTFSRAGANVIKYTQDFKEI